MTKLLLTARDAGSAGHVAALAEGARARGMECLVVAEDAAQAYLAARGVAHLAAADWLGERSADRAEARLQQAGTDVVVCGRSSPLDQGIDQAVLNAARATGTPSVVVQDFWGDVWPESARPDHYLVIDDQAGALTRQRTAAAVHVVGSPKHLAYMDLDFPALRREGRATLGLAPDALVVGYFGQNLLTIPGYQEVLCDVGAVGARLGEATMIYKPHPRESDESSARSIALLSDGDRRFVAADALSIETVLATVDVVLLCFSTVGLDAAYMMCATAGSAASIVCADYPPDVASYWRRPTGLTAYPLVSSGIALQAADRSSLETAVRTALTPAERQRQVQACRAVFSEPRSRLEEAYRLFARLAEAKRGGSGA